MIVKQDFDFDKKSGKAQLRNTFDIGTAADAAKEANAEGGRRGKTISLMGYIPREYWAFDPWLVTAMKALRHGDKYEYMKNVKKFFELHPEFAVKHRQKVW